MEFVIKSSLGYVTKHLRPIWIFDIGFDKQKVIWNNIIREQQQMVRNIDENR